MTKIICFFHIRLVLAAGLVAACVLMLSPNRLEAYGSEPQVVQSAMGQTQTATETQFEFSIFLPFIVGVHYASSFDLIDAAHERGDIDDEMALSYRVFATFGDERLPQRFHGDDSAVIDSDAVSEATLRFAELSPATRETLVPFLIPPVYAGSWYDLHMNGQVAASGVMTQPVDYIGDRCKELAQGLLMPLESDHFVVWHPPFDAGFAQRALQISINMESRIHPILTEMFREPLGDAGLGCNPSDGRLDIYMVYDPIPGKETTIALVSTYPNQPCKAAPTYMLVLKSHRSEVSVIVHEYMHMIQRAYNPTVDCYPRWWKESTATWAMDYFENVDAEADVQFEHDYAIHYLNSTWRWISDIEVGNLRQYGAYLWPFYVSHYTGTYHPEVIAEIFAATEDPANGTLFQAINDHIEGGWAERWPEFAVFNLNLRPHNLYEQWDNFQKRWESDWIMSKSVAELSGFPYWVHFLNGGHQGDIFWLNDVGIYYEQIDIGADVRLWAFGNGSSAGDPNIKVQALLKREGQGWTGPEDWSDNKWHVHCQNDPAGKVQKILLIFSNSNWQRATSSTALKDDTRFVVSDLPCSGWQGTATWQIKGESHDGQEGQLSYTISGAATPKFTLSKRTLVGDKLQLEYQSTGGSATWTTTFNAVDSQTGLTTTCTRTGENALTATMGTLLIVENLNEDMEGDLFSRQFFAAGFMPAPDRCPGLDIWERIPWLQTENTDSALRYWPGFEIGRLQGSNSVGESGEDYSNTTTSTWNLRTFAEAMNDE